jgi:NitT/TauT family transport system ATP-binding protein
MAITHKQAGGGGEVLVQFAQVSKTYGHGERATEAVAGINLTIRAGEWVAVLGPSGCGKSTLLRMIAGLIPPSEGEVRYRGVPLAGVNPHATIVFQQFALFPWLTVQENVEVALKPLSLKPIERTKRALLLLDRIGLDGFEAAYPRELSGGMRQKVGLARALAVQPEVLCLDEPFSALDVLSAENLRNELIELWTTGALPSKAILMVTHNIEEAILLADRVLVMDKDPGRVIGEITISLARPRRRKDKAFLQLVDQTYGLLVGKTKTEAEELGSAPGEPGSTRSLPRATINNLLGLLERVSNEGVTRIDVYRLAEELGEPFDEILPVIEAAEMLGFARVDSGDLSLTTLGQTFADARIQARKEIFAARIKRVPLVRWIKKMIDAEPGKRLSWYVVQTALEGTFTPDEAERQIDTAVDWSRYAELFSYDGDDNTLFIEQEPISAPSEA